MAEESLEDKEPSMAEWKKGKRSKKRHKSKAQNSDIRKLSQPAAPAVRLFFYVFINNVTFFHNRMNQ